MKLFTFLLLLLLITQVWSASNNSNVAATVYGCRGDTITLPFSSHVDVQKIDVTIMSVHFQGKTIATLVDGLTSSVSSYRPRIKFMENGNFILKNVDTNDAGSYSLNVRNNLGKVKASILIDLLVTNKVMYKGTQMVAQLSNKAEWNSDTESFSLSMTCGDFIFKNDNAPIDVEWITPDGSVKNSTKYSEGNFYLQLDNPVEGGQYVCRIPEHFSSTVCATANDSTEVTTNVNENDVQVILLENEIKVLKKENGNFNEQVNTLNQQVEELKEQGVNFEKQDKIFKEQNKKITEEYKELEMQVKHLNTSIAEAKKAEKVKEVKRNSCEDWAECKSGTRIVHLLNKRSANIYCDQDTDGGRWNVFQRRQDGSVDFYRGWSDYRNGFGDPDKEFWLGLETLHQMTKACKTYELRFDLTKQGGSHYYAVYDDFSIGSESEDYAVHFTGYRGNAGDSFSHHKGRKFSTKDRKNENSDTVCATKYMGAWWYAPVCHKSNLNGHYNDRRFAKGLTWEKLTGFYQSLKETEMKFRVKGQCGGPK